MAVPADREVGTERDLCGALRTAYRDLPFASLWRRFLPLDQFVAQAIGCLLQRQTPVIQHEQVVGAANRARDMIEMGVLIGMQPDHFAERQQQAERENRYRGGLPAAVIFLEPVHAPGEGRTCEHRHRRDHKNEMANAVVERRSRRQRQHQEDGLAAGRYIGARQQHQRADDTGDRKTEQDLGKLQREQGRQIRPGHVGHRHQRAIEHFLPRLLEEVREVGQGVEGIARLDDRPRPDQPHDEVAEDQAGQQHIDNMQEAMGSFARAVGVHLLQQQRYKADQSIDQGQPAEDARTDRQAGPKTDDQDRPRRRRGVFLGQADKSQHQDYHRNGERRILRVHEHMPVEGRA